MNVDNNFDNRQVIEEIRSRTDIVAIVDKFVKLRQAGKNFQGLCPFHNEKSPSFIVSPELQRFKCFGCGKSGDVFNFVQEIEHSDFGEVLKKLAKEAGIELKSSTTKSKYSWLEELNKLATQFFVSQLATPNGRKALDYLNNRGIDAKMIKLFEIGFAPGYNALMKSLAPKKYTESQLLESGLFVKKENGIRDKFVNRVMFPIWSTGGVIIGFSGRSLPGDDFGPKYLNSPETPIFHKSDTLLGIYHSKNHIRKDQFAILCEGNLDVISAHKIGIKNIIAPMGTAITDSQLALIGRYTKNILLMFDSDKAGQQATERAFKLASAQDLNIFATNPEPYQDIDELIQKEPSLVTEKIKLELDAFTYLLIKKLDEYDLTKMSDNSYVLGYIHQLLENVKNPEKLQFYLEKARKLTKLEINEDQLKAVTTPSNTQSQQKDQSADFKQQHDSTELQLLSFIINTNRFEKVAKLRLNYFQDKTVAEILKIINDESINSIEELESNGALSSESKELIHNLIFQFRSPETSDRPLDIEDELNSMYKRIYKKYIDRRLDNVAKRLGRAEELNDEEQIAKLLELSNRLRLLKKEIG